MKNFNLIERLLSNSHEKQKPQRFGRYAAMLIMLLTLGVGQMWGQMFGSIGQQENAIQSQQIMSGGAYNGTVYEPFDNSTPSEQSEVGSSYSPSRASGPRRAPLTPGDPGQGPSPVGEPWIMALFAALFAGFIAIRQYKRKMNKSTNMKNSNRFIAVLGLLLTLGVGQMWGSTSVTFYLAVDAAKTRNNNNCCNVQAQIKYGGGGDNENWSAWMTMSKTDYTYNGKPVYSQSFTFNNDGWHCWQFRMEENGNQHWYKSIHCGSWQTDCHNGDLYDYENSTWVDNPSWDASYKVYFARTSSWDYGTPYVYAWNNECDKIGNFPGQVMSELTGKTYNGKQIYYKEVGKRYTGVKFSNNSSNQTADMTLYSTNINKMYYYDGSADRWVTLQYDVTLDQQGGSSGTESVIAVCGSAMPGSKTAPGKTGYAFGGYYTGTNGGGTQYYTSAMASANNWPSDASGPTTLYAKWTANQYNGRIDKNGGASNQSYTATYDATKLTIETAPTRTGYNLSGYYTNASCTTLVANTSKTLQASTTYTDSNGKWKYTSAPDLFAGWTAKNYTVTLDANGGTSDGSITTTYDSNSTSSFSAASYAGYSCDGYFDDPGAGEGNMIIDADGNLADATVSGWLSSGEWVKDGADITLYAHWTEDLTYYDVTFGAGTSYTSLGSLSAKVTSTSAAITSGDDLLSGTGITFTATPETGYEVAGFYSDASCTSSLQSGNTTTYTIASLSDDVTVYVKFVEKTWSVAFAAGAGGSVTTPNSTPQTVGQVTGISIAATPSAGYTFNSWSSSTGGSFVSGTSTNSNTFKPTANTTVTASFNETTFAVTINNGTGDTEVSAATTKATVTCDNADEGKKFSGWTITGTYTLTDGTSTSSRTIKFYATSDVTVTANYANRTYKKVYFENKNSWSKVHAYVWKESGTANASWPGVEITEQTECVNGMTFHYYLFYTDDNDEGDDATSQANWDQVIFSNNGSSQTQNLSLTNGNYYTPGAAKNSTGNDPTADEWYLKGDWDWITGTAFSFATPCGYGTVDKDSWAAATSHAFKIYRSTTSEWWRYNGTVSLGSELALTNASGSDNTYSPSTASDYQFRLDVSDMNNPVLTLVDKNAAGYTVTLRSGANGSVTNAGSLMIYEAMNTEITAVPDPGYNFDSWSVDDDHADHVTITGTNPAIITAKDASAAGAVITANFTNANMIYFDKSAVVGVWAGDDVYVTFFNDNNHWVEYYEGDVRKERVKMQNWVVGLMSKKMDKIPNSNIYYTSTDTDSDGDSEATQWYMFTDKNMVNEGTTWEQAAVCRADFSLASGCNIFVVENFVEKSVAKTGFYYGYWMKYNETTPGIKLHIYEKGGTTNIEGSPFTFSTLEAGSTEFTVTVPLAVANNSYGIELKGDNGIYYKNRGNLTSSACTNWDYVEREATRGTITTTAAGDYKITLSCANKLFLSVEYPLQVGDYRIVYSGHMDTTSTVHTHSSKIIRQLREGETLRKDTVSFYVIDDGAGDPDWSITLQKCTALTPDITWENACGSATRTSSDLSMTGKQGVYIFPLTLESKGGCDGVTLGALEQYTGNFYIRTDGAKGGWEAYKKASDNCMGYSNFSEGHSGYGFYYCHFGRTNDNVKFVIANDYSPELSLTLDGGDYIPTEGANKGKLPYDANIRFMYDSVTNVPRRAYINGSSYGEANYLLLEGDSKIKRADVDKAFVNNDTTFADNGNWIYQLDLRAQPGARVRLTSNYRFNNTDHLQYFKGKEGDFGTSTTEQILGGSGTDWSTLRIIYDFKTNHLVSAWLATDDPVEGPKPIFADVMIVREGQSAPVQITFTKNDKEEDGKLTDVGIVYGVMKFDKSTVNGSGSAYERSLFFISFPFDVKISEIFGFGGFCNQWYLEYYDGKGRAENGFWAESATNWKFITDRTETLKANEGYVLALDLDLMGTTSSVWDNTDEVCLYFPSADTIHNIQATTKSVDIDQTGYLCTIDRYQGGSTGLTADYDRRIKDSYWHCIGVPSFANKVLDIHNGDHDGEAEGTAEYWTTQNLPYFYEWNKATNEMTVKSAANYTFVPMNAYLVQFSQSSLNWGAVNGAVNPAVAPHRSAELEHAYEFNLNLIKNGAEMDHTYVRLTNNEGVTEGFDFGQDLSKEINAYSANIYTLVGYEKAAANSMPLNSSETTIIPVGVKLKQGGDYTFAMPEGTEGVGITLVDNETGIRTSLSALDYTVNLTAGTYNERFVLEISPIHHMPTGIEEVSGERLEVSGARKLMIDGILYIVKDGKMFDARGTRVQ